MFGTLVLGVIFGAAAPFAEPHIKKLLENALMAEMPLGNAELRGLSVAICLLAGALASWLLASGGAVALTLGGVIGVFAPRLLERLRS